MSSVKKEKTKYPNIFKYTTKKGVRYQIRLTYYINNSKAEFNKSSLNSLAEAKALLADIEKMIARKQTSRFNNDEITLNDHYHTVREMKIASKKWNKATTITSDGRFKKISERFGNERLTDLNRTDLQKWVNEQYEIHDYSQETMKGFFRIINLVIDDAVEEDYLDKNRLKKVSIEKEGYEPKKKILNPDDHQFFMDTAKQIMRDDIYTMLYLATFGMRRGEIMGIQKGSIVFLPDGLAKIRIKTTRTRDYPEGKSTKTKKGIRTIVVNAEASNLLRNQLEFVKKIKMKYSSVFNVNDFIFINPKTGNPYHVKVLNDNMNAVKDHCGIKSFPHMLRHIFATNASLAGVDGTMLRNYMGHTDVKMTDHYTHATEEGARQVMQKVDSWIH